VWRWVAPHAIYAPGAHSNLSEDRVIPTQAACQSRATKAARGLFVERNRHARGELFNMTALLENLLEPGAIDGALNFAAP